MIVAANGNLPGGEGTSAREAAKRLKFVRMGRFDFSFRGRRMAEVGTEVVLGVPVLVAHGLP